MSRLDSRETSAKGLSGRLCARKRFDEADARICRIISLHSGSDSFRVLTCSTVVRFHSRSYD